ncbi:MAG: hypothetical protein RRY07_01140 [Bacteroidaceae bacterium]
MMIDKSDKSVNYFGKVRSYKACVHDGIRFITDHFIYFFKLLFPLALAAGLVLGAGGASLLHMEGVSQIVVACSVVLFSILIVSFGVGVLFYVARIYAEQGMFPLLKRVSIYKLTMPMALRNFFLELVFISVFCLFFYNFTSYILYGSLLLIFLLLPFFSMVYSNFLMTSRTLMVTLKESLMLSLRHYGSTLLIIILLGLFVLIALLFFLLPGSVLFAVEIKSIYSELMGDMTDLPSAFWLLQFVCWFVGGALSLFLIQVVVIPLVCQYYSVIIQREEYQELEANRRRIEEEHQVLKKTPYRR